jgi:hypothetical protein
MKFLTFLLFLIISCFPLNLKVKEYETGKKKLKDIEVMQNNKLVKIDNQSVKLHYNEKEVIMFMKIKQPEIGDLLRSLTETTELIVTFETDMCDNKFHVCYLFLDQNTIFKFTFTFVIPDCPTVYAIQEYIKRRESF